MTQEITPEARMAWMSLLSTAPEARLAALFDKLDNSPDHDTLRAPETGGVMVRGRAGGTGAPFNLGEMTVTR
ncbi:MAG: phosphonate C-P lyase system protein PhnG, partial [Tritonibacter mobilis]|nr:phosphonate C-P lyase system protein PhnG [Tritonibacter mobilis]